MFHASNRAPSFVRTAEVPVSKAATLEEKVTTGYSADLTRLLQPVKKSTQKKPVNRLERIYFLHTFAPLPSTHL